MENVRSSKLLVFLANQLVKEGLLEQSQAAEAVRMADTQQVPLTSHLTLNEGVDSALLALSISRCFEMPLYDLDVHEHELIPKEFLTFDFVFKRYAIPLLKRGDTLTIGIIEPNIKELRDISFLTCMNIEYVLVESHKLKKLIDSISEDIGISQENQEQSREFFKTMSEQIGPGEQNVEVLMVETKEDAITSDDINQTPVVRFVNKILLDAINSKSSDIHFEPYEKDCRLRYRQDGVLHEIVSSPKKLINPVVARLKVMANLDITERRVPQDGRFRLILAKGKTIDIRLSTCPTVQGEKVVMRILDPSMSSIDIEQLGMRPEQKIQFLNALHKPQGMILVTGPTGSGKTVTLYTALQLLNTSEKNISTVEDPVEIFLHGVNQVQVNNKVKLTFASALRAFLRQDPDIIMVGEIRDLETAEIGIKAAQTGHLVLSTIHTNNAPLTITRLVSMGIKPWNVTSSITLVLAQRLTRKLCSRCKKPIAEPKTLLRSFGIEVDNLSPEMYEARGCKYCVQGYKGRIGIFEVLPVTPELNEIILTGGSAIEIERYARGAGVLSLRESGLELVYQGQTTLEEINRVTL